MKKKFKSTGGVLPQVKLHAIRHSQLAIIVLMAVIVFSFAACSNGSTDSPAPRDDFYGTWKYINGSFWGTVTLSADTLVYLDSDGNGYTMTGLKWAACTSINGRAGYKITGTVSDVSEYAPYKPGTDTYGKDGDTVIDAWYISADKLNLYWGSWGDLEDDGSDPHKKQ